MQSVFFHAEKTMSYNGKQEQVHLHVHYLRNDLSRSRLNHHKVTYDWFAWLSLSNNPQAKPRIPHDRATSWHAHSGGWDYGSAEIRGQAGNIRMSGDGTRELKITCWLGSDTIVAGGVL